ncbi:Sporulation related domain-containing protein [Thalassospira xiamenensis M-5 = DSM 17429]|uniref:Sporulation domain-containing protein n=2 Tax=Thalassospira xiamenensis TaxID=220697 RepID=A0AB72UC23_9PROT|nr:sporulation domain-containing protein [Thalassospira xiamenensis M-5 = DSM 17429]SIS99708.1 Sporulation related domain-containing protein [Thalassospira xiamenensis M-5 = DSM 17429]
MIPAATSPVRVRYGSKLASIVTGCIAAGLFLTMGPGQVTAQNIETAHPASKEMKSGLDAIPTDLPVHTSSPSPVNQPFSLLPGTIRTDPVLLEDTDRPSLAEQYRMEKQGIKRAPSRAAGAKRTIMEKPAPALIAQPKSASASANTQHVTVSPLIPETGASQASTSTATSVSPAGTDGAFAIQLGAFRDTISAQTYWASFMIRYPDLAQSHPRDLSTADLGTKGTFHRLRLGGFADIASAEKQCRQLLADGTDCFATHNQ